MLNRIREALSTPLWKDPLTKINRPHKRLQRCQIETALANGEIWYLSQMKTGTTFLCNALAFYNAQVHGISGVDFGNIEDGGVSRGAGTNAGILAGALRYKRRTGSTILVQTHTTLPCCVPQMFLCSTRCPFDYAVSSFYFHFRNRYRKSHVSVEEALDHIIERFCTAHKAQKEAATHVKKVVKIRYEELISDKEGILTSIVESIYGYCDRGAVNTAVQSASVRNLTRFEAKQGYASIAKRGAFKEPHFVRSGKIGEGKEFFTEKQIQIIERKLKDAGVPTSGDFDF